MTGMRACRLPGAMAEVPALRMSVSPAAPRSESTSSGGAVPMSSAVVTPNPLSSTSECRLCRWTCASMSPGSSTPPPPSMILAPPASEPMRSPSMTTVPSGSSCRPSNARTFVTAVLGRAAARSVLPMGVSSVRLPLYARYARAHRPESCRRLDIEAGRVGGPPGDVLVGPDEQELRGPRVIRRRVGERERDAVAAGARGQVRDPGIGLRQRGADQREPGPEPVIERGAVRQPGVRQPGARLGAPGCNGSRRRRGGAGRPAG